MYDGKVAVMWDVFVKSAENMFDDLDVFVRKNYGGSVTLALIDEKEYRQYNVVRHDIRIVVKWQFANNKKLEKLNKALSKLGWLSHTHGKGKNTVFVFDSFCGSADQGDNYTYRVSQVANAIHNFHLVIESLTDAFKRSV